MEEVAITGGATTAGNVALTEVAEVEDKTGVASKIVNQMQTTLSS